MAFSNVAFPSRPTVPAVAGVPALFSIPILIATPTLAVADILFGSAGLASQWGIFDISGAPVLIADSCLSIEFRKEFRVADYPIEDGGFASYNKVATPFEPRVVLTKGGGDADRAIFLAELDAIIASLTLCVVVTPEIVYPNVNVTRYDYRRTRESGATLLTVDISLQEIRIVAAAAFTNTQMPAGQDPANGGVSTTQPPTSTQAATSIQEAGSSPLTTANA